MNSNKISQLHVYIIGAVLMLLVGVGLYFTLLKPLNEGNQALAAQIQTVDGTTVKVDTASCNITELDKAAKALEGAKKRREAKQQELDTLLAVKRLPRDREIDLGKGTPQELLGHTMPRWLQLPRVLVETMETYAQRLAQKHKVKVVTKFAVPPPTTNPDAIPKDIIARNLGSMVIEGPFEQVMKWAQDWNSAPLLVAVDGLKCSLAGDKGQVLATASLTVYLFPTGSGASAAAGGAGAGPAAGGPMGGMGGGMGGMTNGPGAGSPMGGMTNGPAAGGGSGMKSGVGKPRGD